MGGVSWGGLGSRLGGVRQEEGGYASQSRETHVVLPMEYYDAEWVRSVTIYAQKRRSRRQGWRYFIFFFLSPSPRDLILLVIQVLCNQDLGLNPPMNER